MFLIGGGDIIVQLLRRSRLVRRRFLARTMPLAKSPLNGGLPVATISAAYFFFPRSGRRALHRGARGTHWRYVGGSTAGVNAIVQFGSVARFLGLFKHCKATQGRTGLYPCRPHSQTTLTGSTDRQRTASSQWQCSTSALRGGQSGGAINPALLESGLKLLQRLIRASLVPPPPPLCLDSLFVNVQGPTPPPRGSVGLLEKSKV